MSGDSPHKPFDDRGKVLYYGVVIGARAGHSRAVTLLHDLLDTATIASRFPPPVGRGSMPVASP